MASSRNEHLRFRYGVCLNDGCSKCKSKEVQQIPVRKELVCAECGKSLRECRRPLTWWEKHGKKVIGGSAVVAILGIGGILLLCNDSTASDSAGKAVASSGTSTRGGSKTTTRKTSGGGSKTVSDPDTIAGGETTQKPQHDGGDNASSAPDATVSDKVREEPQPKAEPKNTEPMNGRGTLNLGYGKYVGDIRNGKPDGAGVLTYTKAQKVVSTKEIVAQPGERIEGVFENGKATFVTLYKKDGNTIKIKR